MKHATRNHGNFHIFYLGLLFLFISACTSDEHTALDQSDNTEAILKEQFHDYEIIEINHDYVLNQVKNADKVVFNGSDFINDGSEDSDLQFDLERRNFETEDFQVIEVNRDGSEKVIEVPEHHVFVGSNDSEHKSSFFIINEESIRFQYHRADQMFSVEPLSDYLPGVDETQFIRYDVDDFITNGHSCGVNELVSEDLSDQDSDTGKKSRTYYVDVTAMGDFSLYTKYRFLGGTNVMTSWMYWNVVSGNARFQAWNGVPVQLRLKRLYYYPYYDGLTDNTGGLLIDWFKFVQRRNWLRTSDVAILYTGNDVDLSGFAFDQTICNSYYGDNGPVAFVKHEYSSYRAQNVTAHEIAHILGHGSPQHSSGGLMSTSVSSWYMQQGSRDQVTNWLSSHNNCLY